MSVTINDLQPRPIKLTVKGVELTSQPLRLKHALVMAKIGSVFENAAKASAQEIETAQNELDAVFAELIPELKEIKLDMKDSMELLQKLMSYIEPDDNKELTENNVKFDTDPKVGTTGL